MPRAGPNQRGPVTLTELAQLFGGGLGAAAAAWAARAAQGKPMRRAHAALERIEEKQDRAAESIVRLTVRIEGVEARQDQMSAEMTPPRTRQESTH